MQSHPRVVISAGHGMGSRLPGQFDPGAKDEAVRVKELASNIVADLRALSHRGMWADFRDRGFFAHADDEAAKDGAHVFLEIHLDAFNGKAHGTTTFVSNTATKSEKRLATLIQSAIVDAIGTVDRGVKAENFAVLTPHAHMASVLSEAYFVDNDFDRAKADKNTKALELAYLNAILDYFGWRRVKTLPRKWKAIRKARYQP